MSDLAPPTTEHPPLEILATYRRGELSSAQEEDLQDHLVECTSCSEAILDLEELANPDPPTDPDQWTASKAAAWEKLRTSVLQPASEISHPADSISPFEAAREQPAKKWRNRSALALAATVAASLAAGFLVASLTLRWGGHRGELEAAHQATREARQSLESRTAELQGAQSRLGELEEQLTALSSPRLNVVELNLFPRGFVRSGSGGEELSLPPDPGFYILTLNLLDSGRAPSYRVRVLDQSGDQIWVGEGLQKTPLGTFSISLPNDFLPPGTYDLRLEAESDQGWSPVAQYPLELR